MKSGFVLIEVLIALVLASIIAAALFSSLYQTNRSAEAIDNLIDIHSKIALVAQQLEKDVSGACIPAQPEQHKEKKEIKKNTHIFFGSNKDGMVDTLTFITNNPLQSHWSSQTGKPKPRIARVVYRLKPEQGGRKKNKPSYVLMRQEDYNLDFDAYKQDAPQAIRSFELIDGIKKMTIKYGANIPKENKPAPQTEKKPETTFQFFDEWNVENQQQKEQKQPKVPQELEITLSVWDTQQKKDVTIAFALSIIPDLEDPSEKKAEQPKSATSLLPQTSGGKAEQPKTPTFGAQAPFTKLESLFGELLFGKQPEVTT